MAAPTVINIDDRVSLRPWLREDAATYVALIHENIQVLAPVARWASPEFAAVDFLTWLAESQSPVVWKLAIVLDGMAVGSLVAEGSTSDGVELSFWIGSRARGRGIVPACIRALEPSLIAEGVLTAEIHAQRTNKSSIDVAEKCGYAVTREYDDRLSRPGVPHVVLTRTLGDTAMSQDQH